MAKPFSLYWVSWANIYPHLPVVHHDGCPWQPPNIDRLDEVTIWSMLDICTCANSTSMWLWFSNWVLISLSQWVYMICGFELCLIILFTCSETMQYLSCTGVWLDLGQVSIRHATLHITSFSSLVKHFKAIMEQSCSVW